LSVPKCQLLVAAKTLATSFKNEIPLNLTNEMFFEILNKKTKIILTIQAICMSIGASTHILWIIENGFFSRNINHPFISTIFWDSLTFIDIIAALLLIFRPRLGILFTLTIITIDVIHNNLILFIYNQHINNIGIKLWATKYWMLIGQLFFLIFVFWTLKPTLTELRLKSISKTRNKQNKSQLLKR
jgi:hypothetical protein